MSAAVVITPLAVGDASLMVEVLGCADLYRHTGGEPPTEPELRARYARQAAGRSPDGSQEWSNWIVRIDDGRPVGYVQASRPVDGASAQIAWVVGVPWQGLGYATAAVRLMVEELAGRGVERITAWIHPANAASVALARRIGMLPTDDVVDGETCWVGRVSVAQGAGDHPSRRWPSGHL